MGAALPFIAIATTALGAVNQAQGQMAQGQAARQAADYRAAVLRNNQIMAERQAQDAIERGKIEEGRYRDRVAALKGRQRVVMAANGFDINEGSNLTLLEDTARTGELDALTIRSNAAREAYGYRVRGQNFGSEAELTSASGRAQEAAGETAAFSSLLGGSGSVASKWYGFKRQGWSPFS